MADNGVTRPVSTSEVKNLFAVGDLLARNYQILGHAGAGGMGIVYRARDLKLERTVALKFLPSEISVKEKERLRFLKEARIASSLDHPNIGSIYGIEETVDGRVFIVMAFYEGQSLFERIHQGGPMAMAEVIDIAVQMTEGMRDAHSHNIVHRDIKPSNVMLTGSGLAKIVDFGLAYTNEQSATLTHGAVGTLSYMAPEQALNKLVDQRADIWALGVVLTEMLTGRNPFDRDGLLPTLLAILNEAPVGVDQVSEELQPILYRALSKDPSKRYQNCSEILNDLEGARTALAQPGEKSDSGVSRRPSSKLRSSLKEASRSTWELPVRRSRKPIVIAASGIIVLLVVAMLLFIGPGRAWLQRSSNHAAASDSDLPQHASLAVLPFPPVNGEARLNALGQGLVESVAAKLSSLAENHTLEIIPAHNLQEKGLTTLADARRQYGANLGLAVTLEKSGDLIKVSYAVMNAQSGNSLGGDSVTVPAADVFSVEENVVEGTVKALRLKLLPEEQTSMKVHGTTASAAYNYYLQARGYLVDYTKLENVDNAIVMDREALKLDPNFGVAKASLGEAYWRKYAITKDTQWTEQAKAECGAAVALGSAGAAGHMCLGLINAGTGEYREAATQFERALELEPSNESAGIGLASALEHQGVVDDAEKTFQRVIDSHLQSYFAYNAMGGFYYRRSQYAKAVQMFQKVTELAPEGYVGYLNLGGTYNDLSRFLEAIAPLKKSIALRPSYGGYTNLGTSYFGLHKMNEAAAAYGEAVRLDPKQYVTWGNLAAAQYYGEAKQDGLKSYRKAAELAMSDLRVNPHDVDILSDLAQYEAVLGNKEQAVQYLGEALQYGHSAKELLAGAAQVYNQLGETGLALEWMTKAIQAGYSPSKFRDLPAFRNLLDNPRYQEIVGKAQTP
jgi:eukaryotic-like serine/threonine-protein kinase